MKPKKCEENNNVFFLKTLFGVVKANRELLRYKSNERACMNCESVLI